VLPGERRRFLATVGHRLTAQALTRREPERRYPILLTLLAESAVDVLDEVVSLFDQAVSAREGKAERSMRDVLVERRKISRQLNKGESLHALKRDLLYAHEGTVRARHLQAQTEQAWRLTLVTNAVVAWTTEYYGLAVASIRAAGRRVDDEVLAHISPAHSENINFFGAIDVDIDAELAQLDPTGHCACATPCSDPGQRGERQRGGTHEWHGAGRDRATCSRTRPGPPVRVLGSVR